jgi:hypothetical protein
MQPAEAEKALRQYLRKEGKQLKQLGAIDVLHIATRFWLETSIEDTRADEGDGLVAYFELLNRRKIVFEFGVNRILRRAEDPSQPWHAWSSAWKLRLSIGFTPTLEVFQLGPVPTTFASWSKPEAQTFVEEVEQSAAFQLLAQYNQYSSSIDLSEIEGPSGEANHPTKGFRWATA